MEVEFLAVFTVAIQAAMASRLSRVQVQQFDRWFPRFSSILTQLSQECFTLARVALLLWKKRSRSTWPDLCKRDVSVREAWNMAKSARRPWRLSKTPAMSRALPVQYFKQLGLSQLEPRQR